MVGWSLDRAGMALAAAAGETRRENCCWPVDDCTVRCTNTSSVNREECAGREFAAERTFQHSGSTREQNSRWCCLFHTATSAATRLCGSEHCTAIRALPPTLTLARNYSTWAKRRRAPLGSLLFSTPRLISSTATSKRHGCEGDCMPRWDDENLPPDDCSDRPLLGLAQP
jgi:hypothetical protein